MESGVRVSRAEAQRNRERVVETAGQLFRARGVDGVGIAELMRESGLTHGGFYGQFESKDALAAEATARMMERSVGKWRGIAAQNPDGALSAIVHDYLSHRHLHAPESGCALTTLSAHAAREGGPMAQAIGSGTDGLARVLEEVVPGYDRQAALAAVAQMAGALMLARAAGDPALAEEIMAAAKAALLGHKSDDQSLLPQAGEG
jgi:TetR/AcrR family transcriptional repressor of nem operon